MTQDTVEHAVMLAVVWAHTQDFYRPAVTCQAHQFSAINTRMTGD